MLLKSTTRHIRIYTAEVKNNQLIESNNVLTLDVDPDNEFNWEEVALNKVYSKFDELVESYNGEELSEYNLRRIGSDLEHFIRSLLQKGEISYNLNARVQNYSMGLPKLGWTIPRQSPPGLLDRWGICIAAMKRTIVGHSCGFGRRFMYSRKNWAILTFLDFLYKFKNFRRCWFEIGIFF